MKTVSLNSYLPKPTAKDFVVKTSFTGESTFNDIVSKYIPLAQKETVEITKAIKLSMMDEEEFVDNDCYTHEVCGYLFDFCKKHIKYKLDTEGLEEIRLPRKTWADRATGVDCEDFVIFLSGILQNLMISHTIKMVDYGDGWQHIYIMVGKYVLDPVQDTFDYESPYKRKKEYFVRVKESTKVLPLGQVMVRKDVLDDILSQAVSLSSLEKKKKVKKNSSLGKVPEKSKKMEITRYYGIEVLSESEQKRLGITQSLGKVGDKKSTYEIITDLVIDMIDKADLPPWQKPWTVNQSGERNFPINFETKRAYTGVNNVFLGMLMDIRKCQCPYFLTFKQLEGLKGNVKKGSKAYPVFFYTSDLYRNEKGKTISKPVWEKLPDSVRNQYEPSFTLKYYNAFNAEDIEGIDFGTNWIPRELPQKEQIDSCENIIASMPNSPDVYNNGGDTAAYYPSLDIVKMPLINYFDKEQFYYSTLFHELVHSTGSPTRLEREEKKKRKAWGDSFYAYEEMIAEMGACYLCGEAGILYYNIKNSARYIKDWKTQVKNYLADDPKFFFRACADAQRAADYILGKADPLVYERFVRIENPVSSDIIHKIPKPKAKQIQAESPIDNKALALKYKYKALSQKQELELLK